MTLISYTWPFPLGGQSSAQLFAFQAQDTNIDISQKLVNIPTALILTDLLVTFQSNDTTDPVDIYIQDWLTGTLAHYIVPAGAPSHQETGLTLPIPPLTQLVASFFGNDANPGTGMQGINLTLALNPA